MESGEPQSSPPATFNLIVEDSFYNLFHIFSVLSICPLYNTLIITHLCAGDVPSGSSRSQLGRREGTLDGATVPGGGLDGWTYGLLVASVGRDEENIPTELNVINLTVACTTGSVRKFAKFTTHHQSEGKFSSSQSRQRTLGQN